jgi:outer membrane receptor protein involved in Fe transport
VRATLSGGSFERREGTLTAGWNHDRSSGTGSASVRALEGWRDHSEWTGSSAFVTLASSDAGRTRARLGVFHHAADAELPGALPKPLLDADPKTASTPLDEDDVTRLHVAGVFESTPSSPTPFTSALYFQTEDRTLTETIVGTQREERETFSYGGHASVRLETSSGGVRARVLAGAEGSFGEMASAFREVDAEGAGGTPLTDAEVTRDAIAGHARVEVDPVSRVTLAAGVRRDDIWAELTPTENDSSGVAASDKVMNAWSPSASVNVRIGRASNVYVQASRSFKTPTLTQLYELRPFPDGFGGTLTLSNAALEPQRATQWELGARARLTRWLAVDVAAYTMNAEEEIGFDLSTFSYANIGASTHRGLEVSVSASPSTGLDVDLGYTLTVAEFDGDFAGAGVDGNQINNVPKHMGRAGLRYTHRFFTAGASVVDVRTQWADEANTVKIPDYTLVDAHGSVTLAGQEIFARVLNVTDEVYAPAAFVGADPETFEPIALFYPAPGRRLEIGLRVALD